MKCRILFAATAVAALSASAYAINLGDAVNLNGYTSFEYEKQWDSLGNGDPKGSFDADMFDLVFNITPVERLRVATDITWEHGATSESGWGNIGIEYGFVEYTATNWFKVRAGKMFTPFGLYTEIHTAKPTFLSVKEPLSTGKLEKIGSKKTLTNAAESPEFDMVNRFFPRWGAGVQILGNIPLGGALIDYNVMLSNGDPAPLMIFNDEIGVEQPFDKDDNTSKAITARVRLTPIDDLRIGVSGYAENRAQYIVEDGASAPSVVEDKKLLLYSAGAQAEWNPGNFGLEYEMIYGGYHTGDTELPVMKRIGMSTQLSYLLFDRLTPYGRWEFFDPNLDKDAKDDRVNILTAGLNFQIIPGYLFLKVDENAYLGQSANGKYKKFGEQYYKYNELHVAIVAGF